MSSTANFRVTYDGPALQESTMDVRELAPALLALGDLMEAASMALYGSKVKATVEVKASFRTGCFGIDLVLLQSWVNKVVDIFSGKEMSAFANAGALLAALGFVGHNAHKGLVAVLKWLRGRPISTVETREDGARILTEDGDMLEVELAVLALLRDRTVREELLRAMAPLDRIGITTVAFGTDAEIFDTVDVGSKAWFEPPAHEDVLLLDDKRKMAFSIVSLAFKEDNKWRLYDGAATIHATIEDEEFLARVDQNLEVFAKGDVLLCSVHVKQWHTLGGARTEYVVDRVLEHLQAARQIPLPLTDKRDS
jgi:hypothetical protein